MAGKSSCSVIMVMVVVTSLIWQNVQSANENATVIATNATGPDAVHHTGLLNASDTDTLNSSLDQSTSTRRPPPPWFVVNMTVNSLYTFECVTQEFPMVWIIGGGVYHFADTPNQNMTRCRYGYVRGCPLSLIMSHRCTGMMHNCTVRVEPPDEFENCQADTFSIKYQCVPAPTEEFPLLPYIITPMVRKQNDPCDPYYQRKNEQLNGTSIAG